MIEAAKLQAKNMSNKNVGNGMIRTTSVTKNVTDSHNSLRCRNVKFESCCCDISLHHHETGDERFHD